MAQRFPNPKPSVGVFERKNMALPKKYLPTGVKNVSTGFRLSVVGSPVLSLSKERLEVRGFLLGFLLRFRGA